MTNQQARLLSFITDRLSQSPVAPSFEEMKDHLGLKSKSGVHRLIVSLVEHGMIVRLPGRARAIALPGHRFGDKIDAKKLAMKIIREIGPGRLQNRSKATLADNIRAICVAAL